MIELLKFTFSLHFVIIWRIAIWSVGLLSLPVHAFSALYRETPFSLCCPGDAYERDCILKARDCGSSRSRQSNM
ncbi:hypothetical protein ACS0TY_023949 [Phlomoides rotata]